MNHYDFQGRSAVITGGAQGFGYAIAERLLQGKAKVVLWDLDDAMLAEARARLEPLGHVETVSVDIADQAAVVRAMEATEKLRNRSTFWCTAPASPVKMRWLPITRRKNGNA